MLLVLNYPLESLCHLNEARSVLQKSRLAAESNFRLKEPQEHYSTSLSLYILPSRENASLCAGKTLFKVLKYKMRTFPREEVSNDKSLLWYYISFLQLPKGTYFIERHALHIYLPTYQLIMKLLRPYRPEFKSEVYFYCPLFICAGSILFLSQIWVT